MKTSNHRQHRKHALLCSSHPRTLPAAIRSEAARCGEQVAFTLTELLVVIGVVALLAATVGTALATTRPTTLTAQCLNNLRQLGLAFRMYAEDNQGGLVYNRDGLNAGKSSIDASWAGGWLDFTSSTDNTNTDLLINHTKWPSSAFFGPYLRTASVFKCPADRSVVSIGGSRLARVRTVALNNFMGRGSRTWTTPSAYSLYTRGNQMASPAKLFLFLDEREDSINDAFFWTDPDVRFHLVDYPGSYHEGAGNFIFADGHGESHRWVDPRTTPPINPGQLIQLNIFMPGNLDIDWLQEHASEHH